MGLFPYNLSEILNGVLAIILGWMFVFVMLHLKDVYFELKPRYNGRGGTARTLRAMYHANKPEIALGTIVAFFTIRTLVLWYFRFTDNHNIKSSSLLGFGSPLLIISTVGLIVGVSCWIRVISPFSGRNAVYLWLIMIITSISFGIGMHYAFQN